MDLARWREEYAAGEAPVDLERFADHVHADQFPHAVIIDCSASAEVANRYAHWLSEGIHVVTPNKKANSAGYEYYERLQRCAARGRLALSLRGDRRRRACR